jgi:hypothetical protein
MTLIFAKFFAKIGVFRFCKNFREKDKIFAKIFSENRCFPFFRKIPNIFVKILPKIVVFRFRENFRENEIFSRNEISRKSAHFRMIFAFSRKPKIVHFRFNPYTTCEKVVEKNTFLCVLGFNGERIPAILQHYR